MAISSAYLFTDNRYLIAVQLLLLQISVIVARLCLAKELIGTIILYHIRATKYRLVT